MLFTIKTATLLCVTLGSVIFAFPGNNTGSIKFSGLIPRHPAFAKQTMPAKGAAVEWRKTGTTLYWNTKESGTMDSLLKFYNRDTTIYDISGNVVVEKLTYSQIDWEYDSMVYVDSSIYIDGKLAEYIKGKPTVDSDYSSRYSYQYLYGGKVIVCTFYSRNDSAGNWYPISKDSVIYSAPNGNSGDWRNDYTNFEKTYLYGFNKENSSWKSLGLYSKIDSESNSTRLVYQVADPNEMNDNKVIITFNTSDWSASNISGEMCGVKNEAGEYYISSEVRYTSTTRGEYEWSSTGDLLEASRDSSFKDSYGNDTLTVHLDFNVEKSTWDSNRVDRYVRVYDDNGNNILTTIWYQYTGRAWFVYQKEINTFEKSNSSVIHSTQRIFDKKISVVNNSAYISFTGSEITSLNLFNLSGRLVTSIRQNASPSITLHFANSRSEIKPGAYIAELTAKSGKCVLPLVVRK